MAEERVQRRLAAILAADVVGYSRLIETDEEGTRARLRSIHSELIDPKIAADGGRIVKTTGDGILVEFGSAVDAVRNALAIQSALTGYNADLPQRQRLVFRVGINLGDVIIEESDIHGDGVNIAARLEGLCEPGEVYVSGTVRDHVEGKFTATFDDLGEHTLKNIARPVRVYRAWWSDASDEVASAAAETYAEDQEIRFCAAPDGVRIAYSVVGGGPTLVKTASWLTHLEYDWESPVWRPLLQALAAEHRLVRYDARGNGLSDWDASEISFEAFVRDLETVVDTLGLDRFALLGISQGCAASVAYAVLHPERVSHLILYGGFVDARVRRGNLMPPDQQEAIFALMLQGWGQDNPVYRQIFTSLQIPDGTPEQVRWCNELERITATPENAVRVVKAVNAIDLTDLLPRVTQPTLVMHRRDDAMIVFDEGRRLASMIPGARFVPLEGRNHVILEGEKEWPRFLQEIRSFLRE